MKTIGLLLKDSRREKKYTLDRLERLTKIKKSFLQKIESEQWNELPEYPVVLGFVKNMASALDLDESKVVAFLRRDYPPTKVNLNPKPDLPTHEIRWSPKLTFLLGAGVVTLIILGYLGFSYFKFISPPYLEVIKPTADQIVTQNLLKVEGKTDSSATVKVNNQPALVSETGEFETEIEISQNTLEISVSATSRSGKESVIKRRIRPELE